MCVRYLDSEFMSHATTNYLLTNCIDVMNNKDGGNHMIHVSMDGPSINGKFFEFLQKDCIDKEQLAHHARCIQNRAESSDWNNKAMIKGEFRVLHDPQKGRLTCSN